MTSAKAIPRAHGVRARSLVWLQVFSDVPLLSSTSLHLGPHFPCTGFSYWDWYFFREEECLSTLQTGMSFKHAWIYP